jgi:predicted ATPase
MSRNWIGWFSVGLMLCSSVSSADPLRIVISGGPGRGKSSVIQELEMRGETVLREAATDYIALQQSKGVGEPWFFDNFQINITKLQLHREKYHELSATRIFQDRSLIDTLGYSTYFQQQAPKVLSSEFNDDSLSKRYFPYVFFVKSLGRVEKTKIRIETIEESEGVDQALRVAYLQLGYEIVDVEFGPVDQRVDQILNFVRSHEGTFHSSYPPIELAPR